MLFCLLLAIVLHRIWRIQDLVAIFRDTTRESVMILMIIGTSILLAYTLADLYPTQSLAKWIAGHDVNIWVRLRAINLILLVAGCFPPPVAIILMTTPILLPIIITAGFDVVWFGVILTINMEVGLNLYVINGIALDVPLARILWGSLPYVLCMVLAILISRDRRRAFFSLL